MIAPLVAPLSRPIARRLVTAAALAVVLAATGCREGGQASAAQRDPDGAGARSSGEVVIAAPRDRYRPAAVAATGTVTGTVALASPLPALAPVSTGPDSAACGATIPDESLSAQGRGVGGVVVWLEGIRTGRPLPLERRLELGSERCRLSPRVQAGVVNSAVNVLGHDDFRQHLRFQVGGEAEPRARVLLDNYEQVIPTELPFRAPGLVTVSDADHSWPRAYIAVFDHPYFAVTGANGTFTIEGVPAGRYTLVAWHERAKRLEQTVEVTTGGSAAVSLALEGR